MAKKLMLACSFMMVLSEVRHERESHALSTEHIHEKSIRSVEEARARVGVA